MLMCSPEPDALAPGVVSDYTVNMDSPRLQTRRVLSPQKLKRARLNAQMTNVAKVARDIGVDRSAYLKWEDPEKGRLTYVDFVAMSNALALFGVSYEDISDPISASAPA